MASSGTRPPGTRYRVLVVEYNRAYPGPGAAAAILAARQTDAAFQGDITTVADLTATPGMAVSVAWDDTPYTIRSVRFDLGTGLMSLTWGLTP